jgi:hypothetical protein
MHISAVSLDLPSTTPTTGKGLPSEAGLSDFEQVLLKASQHTPSHEDPSLNLKAVALGSVELITAQTPAPDASELKAFAAAQGINPEAVAWLFASQDPPTPEHQLLEITSTEQATEEASLEANLSILGILPLGLPQWAPLTSTPSTNPPIAPADIHVLPAGWQSTQVILSAGGKPAGAAANTTPAEPPIPEEWMDLLELDTQAKELLGKLGLLDKEAPTGKSATPGLAADLRSPLDALQRPVLLAGQAAAAPTAAQAENATPADRAAQIQALAEKIGQALGQRIMGNIERGQWQVRLLLRPASLGEVEVDLRLRAGELDATLRAMNPLTRELLTEGLPRLREGLTQAGMDVAQLNVGTGDTSRNGGNPTPRSYARKPEQSASGAAEGSSGAQPLESSAIRRTGANGWDVLV